MINLLLTQNAMPVGGAEIMILNCLRKLDRQQFKVHLATLTSKGALLEQASQLSDDYFLVARRLGFDPIAVLRLRGYIRLNRIQVVHSNGWIDSMYVECATAGLPVRKVSTIHGHPAGWRLTIQRLVLRRFDRAICVSESLSRDAKEMGYSPHNLVVVHNGVDLNQFGRTQDLRDSNRPFAIGMIGAFRKERDHLTLCRAARHLIDTGTNNFEVRLIGRTIDPESEKQVRDYCAQHGLGQHVRFLGACQDIPARLNQLDIYVASSLSETFGLALLEAMANSLPVVSSAIPAFLEILGESECGLKFCVGDHKELSRHLQLLMRNSVLRERYGALAARRSREFSIESTIQRLEELYQEVVNT